MSNIYTYSFNTSVPNQDGGSPAILLGSFSVDYDNYSIEAGSYLVSQSNLTLNGVALLPASMQAVTNALDGDGKNIYRTSFANPNNNYLTNMNFYYKTEYPSSIYNLRASEFVVSPPNNMQNNYFSPNLPVAVFAPVCFSTGTNILTQSGDVPVEQLAVGDLVVTTTGETRPIRWIGHRDLDGHGCGLPHDQQPVRIRAGAFGAGLPARDLRLSPGHPVLVGADAEGAGGHLVPVMCLINGTTIVREPVTSVTYWHVELDGHDILLAEGLPAESYLDWGDRPFFTEASDHALHNPDFVVPGLRARCRPVAVDGPVVEAERARLSGVFAASLGAACAWDAAERFAWVAA